MTTPFAILLIGPTASGKTTASIELAQHFPIEIISVDSALVFRGMDIGTAKPDAHTLAATPHHLIDILDPTDTYSAAQFCTDAKRLIAEIQARGNIPLLVGGTMLYFNALQYGLHDLPAADEGVRQALTKEAEQIGWAHMHAKLEELDPVMASRIEKTDAQRIQRALEVCLVSQQTMSGLLQQKTLNGLTIPFLKLSLIPSDRSVLHDRITARFDQMMAQGLIEEVQGLQIRYPNLNIHYPSMRCVGYRQVWQYLAGELDLTQLRATAHAATRQLAKRQLTWLRGMEDAVYIDCIDPHYIMYLKNTVSVFLEKI